jgi:O-antigen/teichoic acid export membrane protein
VLANGIIGLFDTPLDQLEGATLLFLLAGLALGQSCNQRTPQMLSTSDTATGTVPKDVSQAHLYRESIASSEAKPDMRKTGRAIVLQLCAWGVAVPLAFPATALLAHYLGPAQYGAYSLTFPFLTFFALLGGTGMDPLLIRQLSRQPRTTWGETLSYAAGTRAIAIFLSCCAAMVTAWLLPISTEQRMLFWLGSITLFFSFSFNGLRFIYTHGFRAEQRIGSLAILETCNRLITAGLIGLVIWLRWPLLWIYALLIYSDLPLFLLQVWMARRQYAIHIRFNLTRFREHMLTSLPLLAHQGLMLFGGLIDQCVLAIVAGPGPVGLYALASRVVDPLISIAFAYVNGLYPLLCTTFEEGRQRFADTYYHAVRLLTLAIVPLAVSITVLADLIASVLGGPYFMAAADAIQLLIWSMMLTFVNQASERACTAAHLERRIPLVTGIATATNLLLNITLIPHWQIVGAGIAALLSEACTSGLFLFLLKPYIHLRAVLGMVGLILLSNVPMLAFLIGFRSTISLWLLLPFSLSLTIALYFVTRILTWKDIRSAQDLFFAFRKKRNASVDHQRETITEPMPIQQNWHLSDYPTMIVPSVHP